MMNKDKIKQEELVAVITAAIMAAEAEKTVKAVEIKRSDAWVMAGRQAGV